MHYLIFNNNNKPNISTCNKQKSINMKNAIFLNELNNKLFLFLI